MEALDDDLREIAVVLSQPDLRHEALKIRNALMKVHKLANKGKDVTALAGYVIKLLPSHDTIVKKLACQYVVRFSNSITDVHLMVINSLYRDCTDPNPGVRALALHTLCPSLQAGDHMEKLLSAGLQDKDAHVRRCAALCCGIVNSHSPEFVTDQCFVDDLYTMLRDADPVVVTNCLITIDEILQEEGGVVINKNIAHYLIGRISEFTEWNLVCVLRYLRKFYILSEDEVILDFLNQLASYFEHSNSSVVIEAIQLFCHFSKALTVNKSELLEKAKPQLCSFLLSSNPELTYAVLKFIKKLIEDEIIIFSDSYARFFCKSKEPLYVKEKKIELLALSVTPDNVHHILENLVIYSRDPSKELSSSAIKAIIIIASKNTDVSKLCMENLLQLLELEDNDLTNEVIFRLHSVKVHDLELQKEIITKILLYADQIDSPKAKSAFAWLIGEYGIAGTHDCHFILEKMLKKWDEENDLSFRLNTLVAILKMFFVQPAELQDLVGQVFELCLQDSRIILRDRAMFYYRLLETDVNLAKSIIKF